MVELSGPARGRGRRSWRLSTLPNRVPKPWRALLPRSESRRSIFAATPAWRCSSPDVLPEATARDAANNLLRLRVLEQTYRQLASLPVDFVALKGITQCALFGIRPEDRAQSDIDLYCPREYRGGGARFPGRRRLPSHRGLEAFPTDHLPALIRPNSWKWRGDFFDPEMPLAIELHFQFWNPELEFLPAEGIDEFWRRRTRGMVAGVDLPVLSPLDAAAYAALHLLKHVLHGDTRPFHVYELASFLHLHAEDEELWSNWRTLHSESLRRLQSVSFLLAETWFGCRLAPVVREEIERLHVPRESGLRSSAPLPRYNASTPTKTNSGCT